MTPLKVVIPVSLTSAISFWWLMSDGKDWALIISISYFDSFWNGAASEERSWDGRVGVDVD